CSFSITHSRSVPPRRSSDLCSIVETTRPPDTFGTQYANFSGVSKVEAGTVRDMLPPGDGEVGAWWRGGWSAEPRVTGGVPRVAGDGGREAGGGWRAANVCPVGGGWTAGRGARTGETCAGRGARGGWRGAGRDRSPGGGPRPARA